MLNSQSFETYRSVKILDINGSLPVGNFLNHQPDLAPLDNLLNFGRSITNLGSSTAVAAAQVGFSNFRITFAFLKSRKSISF